ncbi:arginine and glutamate-rich protein 1 [Tanacetum coccineum]
MYVSCFSKLTYGFWEDLNSLSKVVAIAAKLVAENEMSISMQFLVARAIVKEDTAIVQLVIFDDQLDASRQQEAELKLVEEETAKRVEEAIRKKVEERLGSEEIKLEIERQLEEGRKKVAIDIIAQLEKEKEDAIIEARRKEEQAEREKEELERLVEQNKRRIEEAQRREAMEQQRREEERYRELEELQRQKEEALLRKKQQEEEERAKQQKLLGKNKSRPKLSFALGSK